ncbi:hypothetical protein GCM10020220_086470 [Nonomuraea rubra]|uniref:hypothetical protein n=1 Tax=Nonomuraea rubra TaxID=46180 RepID=UPI0031E81F7C
MINMIWDARHRGTHCARGRAGGPGCSRRPAPAYAIFRHRDIKPIESNIAAKFWARHGKQRLTHRTTGH